MNNWFKSGTPWVWLNAGAVAICLVMVVGLLLLIATRGLGHFWPSNVMEFDYAAPGDEPVRVLGELSRSETMTAQAMREAGYEVPEGQDVVTRHLIKRGNRDVTNRDFVWYVGENMSEWRFPQDAMVIERLTWGDFIGYLVDYREDGEVIASGREAREAFQDRLAQTRELVRERERIERFDIGNVNFQIEQVRLQQRALDMNPQLGDDERAAREAELAEERERLELAYAELEERRNEIRSEVARFTITGELMDGETREIALSGIVKAWWPNDMTVMQKTGHYVQTFWEFVSGFPREANTEGGILPAIFGTVLMVMIMSIVVTPFGVMAAIYLREYAKQGPLVRTIRISVNNLAGVPSIVFGVFGLGFFVYAVGGSIDRAFFPEALPAPTFGGPAIIWASLTLALLTLPVVIVSTEEGLTRIPSTIRQGSLALGATKAETLWRLVIPLSAPAMMTGLILAVARAAGEVAPLMLVGVVKLAPSLPMDGNFPFLHLDRAFMHLGFHIYDVGFQSPNVEAGRPLVYATALILVLLIIVLNVTAITIRNHLREKYRSESD
ncbi:phosphate transport system permease protein [Natronocella acetinitrilica]|uniref:Phosphate transport system permease protein PstA n=1 Tax=Natronocella acetinitrilica TaxID=414046 RepID=A0AAE3G8D6_9GAMM|nr:phosphate ABC transporter permease PstA [Natronocella acetinitrilica]MCP1676676.1 phosphate transport system permease protein [Natronocella acetinitrilica]